MTVRPVSYTHLYPLPPCPEQNPGVRQGCPDRWGSHCPVSYTHLDVDKRQALERSLTKDEERIEVLEKMVLRLYEDMVAGRISEANFNLMLDKMCIRDRMDSQ